MILTDTVHQCRHRCVNMHLGDGVVVRRIRPDLFVDVQQGVEISGSSVQKLIRNIRVWTEHRALELEQSEPHQTPDALQCLSDGNTTTSASCVRTQQMFYINISNISIILTRKYPHKYQRVCTSYIFRLKEYYLIFFILYCINLI